MSFSSLQDFLQMGGYAFYVWMSFGLSLLVLSAVMLAPLLRHRRLLRDQVRHQRLNEHMRRKSL
jgi:heme exporter protein D